MRLITGSAAQLRTRWTSGLANGQPFPSLGSRDKPVQNADGSTDLYLGPKAPQGKDANWLATVPGKGYFAIIRLYGPTEAAIEKSWQLVFAIDSASRATAALFMDSVRIPCPHCGAEQSHVVLHGTAMTWWECPTCASVWPMAAIRTYGIAPKALAEHFRCVAEFAARELLEHPFDALKLLTEPPSSPYDDAVVVRR